MIFTTLIIRGFKYLLLVVITELTKNVPLNMDVFRIYELWITLWLTTFILGITLCIKFQSLLSSKLSTINKHPYQLVY